MGIIYQILQAIYLPSCTVTWAKLYAHWPISYERQEHNYLQLQQANGKYGSHDFVIKSLLSNIHIQPNLW